MEKSVQSLYRKRADAESVAKFLRQDLRILRFIETFSESAPQLALMLTIILHQGRLDPVTGTVCYSAFDHVYLDHSGVALH